MHGTGGGKTKISACIEVMESGREAVICGFSNDVLIKAVERKKIKGGTYFIPRKRVHSKLQTR